jgi:hypothetical protein
MSAVRKHTCEKKRSASAEKTVGRLKAFLKVLTVVSEWELTQREYEALVKRFAELLQPTGYYAARIPLRRVLCEAAQQAGWYLLSPKIQQRQMAAVRGRTNQREEDLAIRRVFVAALFKRLPLRLRQKPGSLGTAQAIIGQLEKLLLTLERKPLMTIRTIQADILFMRRNGNFGI